MPPTTYLPLTTVAPEGDPIADLRADALHESYSPRSGSEVLLDAIEAHIEAELATLPQYEEVARNSHDPVVELVMRMILTDEAHHHGLLQRMGASLRDALYWSHSADALPPTYQPDATASAETVQAVKSLIDEEVEGAHKLREIAHKQRTLHGGLVPLLLEVMAHDSEKHAKLLTFVKKRLEDTARSNAPG